jgi:alpha-galactosidase
LVYESDGIEIWKTPKKNSKDGWIGIFNRSNEFKTISLNTDNFGADFISSSELYDVWNNKKLSNLDFEINANGVVFLKYSN